MPNNQNNSNNSIVLFWENKKSFHEEFIELLLKIEQETPKIRLEILKNKFSNEYYLVDKLNLAVFILTLFIITPNLSLILNLLSNDLLENKLLTNTENNHINSLYIFTRNILVFTLVLQFFFFKNEINKVEEKLNKTKSNLIFSKGMEIAQKHFGIDQTLASSNTAKYKP